MQRKDTLYRHTPRHLPDREGLPSTPAAASENCALKQLDPLFLSFSDLDMDPHSVTRTELWDIRSQIT